MSEHHLKILPNYYGPVESGAKPFEVRKDDRNFETGDILWLEEWHEEDGYTGRILRRTVGYIMRGPGFGIEPGHCVMAIS